MTLSLAAVIGASAAAHAAIPPPPPPPPSPPPADWVPGQLPAAREARVGLDCRVTAQQRAQDCAVVSEPISGLGAQAVRDVQGRTVTVPEATPNSRAVIFWPVALTAQQIANDPLNPTPEEVERGYPAILCQANRSCLPLAHYTNRAPTWGDFAMDCELAPSSQLVACRVTSETLPGLSATQAARDLVEAPSNRLRQNIIGPVNVRFAIPMTQEQSAQARQVRPAIYTVADWAQRPTPAQMMAVYPPRARQAGIRGTAVLICTVTATGALADCSVVSETPRGEGFGAAALRLAQSMRMRPRLANGVAIEGTIRIPLNFAP